MSALRADDFDDFDRDQRRFDSQPRSVPVDTSEGPATPGPIPNASPLDHQTILDRDQDNVDSQRRPVPVEQSSADPAIQVTIPSVVSPDQQKFVELRMMSESFEDAQKARVAIENRLRSGTDLAPVAKALKAMRLAEDELSREMERLFRKAVPEVAAWAEASAGIGGRGHQRLIARLIATIGHPVIANPYHWEGEGSTRELVADPPFVRNVAKLWAYCGHGDPNRKRRKGMSAEEAFALGNPRAKMLVHLLAESCIKCVGAPAISNPESTDPAPAADTDLGGDHPKADTHQPTAPPDPSTDDAMGGAKPSAHSRRRSPYRDTYDLAKATYADREDWTDGHRHNAALRLVGKAILVDLHRVASTVEEGVE